MSRAARIKIGELVWLFDECGIVYRAKVDKIGKNSTYLSILEKREKKESGLKMILAQAMIKAKKMELVLQKSTELGVDTFIPVVSALSVVRLEGKEQKKMERWERIVREAAKQCGRSAVPHISSPMSLKNVIQNRNDQKKLFLNEKSGRPLRDVLLDGFHAPQQSKASHPSVLLLVGPEGGWTEEEERAIKDCGFEALSLGSLVLRSETAAISSIAMISHFWKA